MLVGGDPMMEGQLGANVIALVALLFSLIATAFSWYATHRADRREDRIEKSTAYLELEVHSSEAFRFAAAHADAIRPYEASERPERLPKNDRQDAACARQYYYQCLNLFEVCSNFRRNRVIEKQVYASWVAWFHEVLDQWYFRELWEAEMRENYTDDVRHIFDAGLQIYAAESDPDERRREFYRAVGHLLGGCPIISEWPDKVQERFDWAATKAELAGSARG